MSKRGQITVFMILGFVILVVVLLLYFLQDNLKEAVYGQKGTKSILDNKLDAIRSDINKCVKDLSAEALVMMGNQGGTITPSNYIQYRGNKISYLCFDYPLDVLGPDGKHKIGCSNQMLTETEIKKELENYVTTQFNTCFDIEAFKQGDFYTLTHGDFTINATIENDYVRFDANYPVEIERKSVKSSFEKISIVQEIPIGRIQKAVNDILSFEAINGEFDNVGYTLTKQNDVEVLRNDSPYPDTIYTVKTPNSEYKLQFAIKGVDMHA